MMKEQNYFWFLILFLSLCCFYVKNHVPEIKEAIISRAASILCHEICMECVRSGITRWKDGSITLSCVEYKYTGKEICEPEVRKFFKSELERRYNL